MEENRSGSPSGCNIMKEMLMIFAEAGGDSPAYDFVESDVCSNNSRFFRPSAGFRPELSSLLL